MFKKHSALPIWTLDRHTIVAMVTFAVALIVTFAAYYPGLSGPLILDDLNQLKGIIENSGTDSKALFDQYIISNSGPLGRPVAMASFIGSAIGHGPDTWWWKYDNVMFHLISGLLVFWLASLVLTATNQPGQKTSWLAAATIAAIWLLHPLHVSTVLYTVQRMTELSSLFVFAGLICYMKGRLRQIDLRPNGWLHIGIGFCLFFPLAIFSKETALLFPVYCSLIEVLIFKFRGNTSTHAWVRNFHGVLFSGYLLAALYIVVNFSSFVLKNYAIRDFTFAERIFTELRIVVLYLSQILLPSQSKMGFFHDDFTLSTSLFSPVTTILSALLLAAILSSAVYLRKRLPLYAFGILFFFAGHLLESTIFSLELVFEHRNYLPSLGILLAVLAILQSVVKQRKYLTWIAAIGLATMSLLTWQRADTWGSQATMYQFMNYAHPQSPRLNLAYANFNAGIEDYAEARKSLAKIPQGIGPSIHELFLDCMEYQTVAADKIQNITRSQGKAIDGHVSSSIVVLTKVVLAEKCTAPKQELVALIDRLMPLPARSYIDKKTLLNTQALILIAMDRVDDALSVVQTAHEINPDNAMPLYFSANALAVAGRLDEATTFLTSAYELEKTTKRQYKSSAKKIYLEIGAVYLAHDQIEKALALYTEGALSMPAEPEFYIRKTRLLIQLGRYEEAERTIVDLRALDASGIAEYEPFIRRLEQSLQGD